MLKLYFRPGNPKVLIGGFLPVCKPSVWLSKGERLVILRQTLNLILNEMIALVYFQRFVNYGHFSDRVLSCFVYILDIVIIRSTEIQQKHLKLLIQLLVYSYIIAPGLPLAITNTCICLR